MKKIIYTAINRPIGTIMIFLAIILSGIISLLSRPIEFLPDIQIPTIVVSTVYPSASPEDVRKLVTIPLENALSSVKGLKKIKSVSRNSISTIELNLGWNINIIEIELQVREILDSQYAVLPDGAYKPKVLPTNPDNEPLLIISFAPKNIKLNKLRTKIDREIRTELQQLQGVGAIIYTGGAEQEIVVSYDPTMLTTRGLTPESMVNQFKQIHNRYPAGSFIEGDKEYLVIGDSELKTLNDISQINMMTDSGSQFSLRELADVKIENCEQRSLFYANGQETIGLIIYKQKGSNPVSVSSSIRNKLPKIQKSYGDFFTYEILSDSSNYTLSIIMSILQSILLGSLIAFLVLWLITQRLLMSMMIIITLPVSFIITSLCTGFAGISINIMSLGGIAIAVGMLVDNSVIVLENIDKNEPFGYSIAESTIQVAGANLGSTITSIIVFLPLVFLPGVVGAIYKDLAITVTFSLIGSYIVSITLLPSIYNIVKKSKLNKKSQTKNRLSRITKAYGQTLKQVYRKKYIFPIIIITVIAVTIFSAFFINLRLSTPDSRPEILIDVTAEPGTRMEELCRLSDMIYNQLSSYSWFDSIYFRAGAESDDAVYYANPRSSSNILKGVLKIKKNQLKNIDDIISLLNDKIVIAENFSIRIYRPTEAVSKLLGIADSGKNYLYSSDSSESIKKISNSIEEKKLSFFPSGYNKFLEISPKRKYLDRAGVTPATANGFLQSQISGLSGGEIDLNNEPLNIRFRAKKSPWLTPEEIADFKIPLSSDNALKAGELFNFNFINQPSALYREHRKDCLIINIDDDLYDSKELEYYKGYNTELTAIDNSVLMQNINEIGIIFIIALIFLYLYLGFQFESFSIPLILLSTVPLSLSGVFIGLIISKQSLDLNSGIGILVLFGIVVNNAILLRERSNQLSSNYHSNIFCILNGSIERLRPILITSATTIFSLFPIAIELFGPTQQQGLAWVIIGGLSISTLLSLFIIPVLLGFKK
ncbi:MAG: efflux RND transporter permease subunit [Spirochaetales bacterium]|nr:efflux RND transporter permease subunit [Spirochaetales bacterium]